MTSSNNEIICGHCNVPYPDYSFLFVHKCPYCRCEGELITLHDFCASAYYKNVDYSICKNCQHEISKITVTSNDLLEYLLENQKLSVDVLEKQVRKKKYGEIIKPIKTKSAKKY